MKWKKLVFLILQIDNIKIFYICVFKNILYDEDGAIKCRVLTVKKYCATCNISVISRYYFPPFSFLKYYMWHHYAKMRIGMLRRDILDNNNETNSKIFKNYLYWEDINHFFFYTILTLYLFRCFLCIQLNKIQYFRFYNHKQINHTSQV